MYSAWEIIGFLGSLSFCLCLYHKFYRLKLNVHALFYVIWNFRNSEYAIETTFLSPFQTESVVSYIGHEKGVIKELRLWIQMDLALNSSSTPLTSCMALGKLLLFSKPKFSHYKMGIIIIIILIIIIIS